ncbi:MAG TPA: protein-glutamate O-methyltransferase CheR [Burkholderiaceae bacterium]|nr:protein-glutamate O-methyltransferase CheR [Burkholderiaceae bacterium]
MNPPVSSAQLDRFQRAVTQRLALEFERMPTTDLAGALDRRMHARGMTIEAYLAWLESTASDGDVPALARELTVGETSFFRNIEQFRALREVVVPALLSRGGAMRPLRILSAGCSSGEEAYSIAMTLREMGDLAPPHWTILAVDVNPAVIEKARKGIYTTWSMRDTPPDSLKRWFRVDGNQATLDPRIVRDVVFQRRNLADDDGSLWRPCAYDIVFCRNMLMYFTRPALEAAVARIERSLEPDGVLFLGHAETLRGLSQGFALRPAQGAFYYERSKAGAEPPEVRLEALSSMPVLEALAALEPGHSFERSNLRRNPGQRDHEARAGALLGSAPASRPGPSARALDARPSSPPSSSAQRSLADAFDLFRLERFSEALALLRTFDADTAQAQDALLLHALLLTHGGDFAAAEKASRRLLAVDESHAGAFYLLALCREGLGDPAGAARDDRCAIDLDPAFSMPRLHLGVLARRAGDSDAAKRHLGIALALLEREDEARLGLFAGGFGREALLALCRAELRQCEVGA